MKRSGLPAQAATDPTSRPMTPRELVWLVLQRPDQHDEVGKTRLLHAGQAVPGVDACIELVQEFAIMVRERQNERL